MDSALKAALALTALIQLPLPAHAGTWTQEKGSWFVISSFDVARAGKGFDDDSRPRADIKFDKSYLKTLAEFGLTSRITLFAVTDYVAASVAWAGHAPFKARDLSLEGGARMRVLDDDGTWSLQASYKAAGPFDLSNSFRPDAARVAELRTLYGTSFKFFGRDGFADVEAAQRWITHPRPNETVLDLSAGLWLDEKTMAMLQVFNTVSAGNAEPPYTYFRTHKLELSVVRCLTGRISLQVGAFVSPAGQNSLVEQGLTIALWMRH
jgi:hypothetical protein